jgi:predicted ribosome-associated RNA-binding protein Tma20
VPHSLNRAVEKALHLDPDSTALDALLPAKAGELEVAKLPAPSRLVIYLLDGVPVLLDTSGKSDFVPTVLGLWSCPDLLPVVTCKAWQVSQYLVGGEKSKILSGNTAKRSTEAGSNDLYSSEAEQQGRNAFSWGASFSVCACAQPQHHTLPKCHHPHRQPYCLLLPPLLLVLVLLLLLLLHHVAGADLMLPGVHISSLPDFNKGTLLAVCVPGNPAPIAVGAAVMNSMTAKGQVRLSVLCHAVLC